MIDPYSPDEFAEFEIVSECVTEIDPVVVEGIRRGLADANAGRVQSLDEFDAEFRSQFGIPASGDAGQKNR